MKKYSLNPYLVAWLGGFGLFVLSSRIDDAPAVVMAIALTCSWALIFLAVARAEEKKIYQN